MSDQIEFSLEFPRASHFALSCAVLKQSVDDFYVEELFGPELSGSGEHVWLYLEKRGQNTEYLAKQLAQFAGIKPMDVGYSGLKDRWAQTRQWFSLYLGNKPEPDWTQFQHEGVELFHWQRHSKKLRRGEHWGNRFKLVLRNLEASNELEQALNLVKTQGFPNYFGPQRFGRKGENLVRGKRYFEGQIKASRSQRGFYLSAARSYLFNVNLGAAIASGAWLAEDAAGPMFGDPQPEVQALSEAELVLIDQYPMLKAGLHKNRLKLERRPYRIMPDNFTWDCAEKQISLSFDLPTGVFATALLSEIFVVSEPDQRA